LHRLIVVESQIALPAKRFGVAKRPEEQWGDAAPVRAFRLLVAAVQLRGINVKGSPQYVQDIFTIRPIAKKYQNGIAAPTLFRGDWRGIAFCRIASTAGGTVGNRCDVCFWHKADVERTFGWAQSFPRLALNFERYVVADLMNSEC
jgi:hypothetical protein